MSPLISRIIGFGLLFGLIFLTGYRMSRLGKPYNALLFNLHKFLALGAVAFLVVTVVNVQKIAPLYSLQVLTLILTGLCFIVTIVVGGLVSIEKPMPGFIPKLHRVMPYLTLAQPWRCCICSFRQKNRQAYLKTGIGGEAWIEK
jgi:ABC-type transport system involved in multi-copper enzyme maturation permease subunit